MNLLNSPNADEGQKEFAKEKLQLNVERTAKLKAIGRNSYGRTDEDCVILKDKSGNFIAGYNAQFIEENKYGLIVYAYIPNKLTSHVYEESTHLYYAKARYYDPEKGRMISTDPLRNGSNWYVYVLNNLINYVDPSGENPLAYLQSIEASKAVILIVSLIASGITAYEIGNRLYREGIPFTSLLIDALKGFGILFDSNTMNEMMHGYEDGSWVKSGTSYQSSSAKNRSLLESPKFKAEQPEPSIELLIPPKVPGIDNMEIFPEAPKELTGNIIIDYPFNLELSNYIFFTSSDILRKEFNGGFSELPVLLRNMWNNVIYSKGGINTGKWNQGSYDNAEKSLMAHYNKHGREVGAESPEQYLRKAEEFAKTVKKNSTKSNVEGAVEGVTRYKKNGKYIDLAPDGTIISYGKQ